MHIVPEKQSRNVELVTRRGPASNWQPRSKNPSRLIRIAPWFVVTLVLSGCVHAQTKYEGGGGTMQYPQPEGEVPSINKNTESLLRKQVGEFAYIRVVDRSGKTRYLTSNSINAVITRDKILLPQKRIALEMLKSETRIVITGSPNCEIIYQMGEQVTVNLDGGPEDECP